MNIRENDDPVLPHNCPGCEQSLDDVAGDCVSCPSCKHPIDPDAAVFCDLKIFTPERVTRIGCFMIVVVLGAAGAVGATVDALEDNPAPFTLALAVLAALLIYLLLRIPTRQPPIIVDRDGIRTGKDGELFTWLMFSRAMVSRADDTWATLFYSPSNIDHERSLGSNRSTTHTTIAGFKTKADRDAFLQITQKHIRASRTAAWTNSLERHIYPNEIDGFTLPRECEKCEYDMRGLPEPANCPECGQWLEAGRYTWTFNGEGATKYPAWLSRTVAYTWTISLVAMLLSLWLFPAWQTPIFLVSSVWLMLGFGLLFVFDVQVNRASKCVVDRDGVTLRLGVPAHPWRDLEHAAPADSGNDCVVTLRKDKFIMQLDENGQTNEADRKIVKRYLNGFASREDMVAFVNLVNRYVEVYRTAAGKSDRPISQSA